MPGWDESKTEWRYRIREPSEMIDDSYSSIRLRAGIRKLIARLKSNPRGSKVGQALRFKKDVFTLPEAKNWLNTHPNAKKHLGINFITLNTMVNVK